MDSGLDKAQKELVQSIKNIHSFEGLLPVHEQIRSDIHQFISGNAQWQTDHSVISIMELISEVHDSIWRRVIHLTIRDLQSDGHLIPEGRFVWIALGSGARREQMIITDQDHALLYDNTDIKGEFVSQREADFHTLSKRVVQGLKEAGYPLCEGNVMASNTRWRGTGEDWRHRLDDYLALPNWDNVRLLLIATDMRAVYGELSIVNDLRQKWIENLSVKPFPLWLAAKHELMRNVGMTTFHHLKTESDGEFKGLFDIKNSFYGPLIRSIRLWAIFHKITAPSSLDRLILLREKGVWSDSFWQQVYHALLTAFVLRVRVFLDTEGSRTNGMYVDPHQLPQSVLENIYQSLKVTRKLQRLTAKHFRKPE